MDKPPKKLYKNQTDVWNKALPVLEQVLKKSDSVKEAYVWASLAEGKFGLYEETYQGREGSDVDLVIVMNEPADIPTAWEDTTIRKSFFDLYKVGMFTYDGHKHPIDGLVVFPSRHDLTKMKERLEGRSKQIK